MNAYSVKWAALFLIAMPAPAFAHAAFGDLGPFYQALLHPLADPAQGLLLAAAAVALARQPIGTVRPAFAALAGAGFATLALGALFSFPAPGQRILALVAMAVVLVSLLPVRSGARATTAVAVGLGVLAALPVGSAAGVRDLVLGLLGGAAGIALVTLFLWGATDWADRHISPVASAVAAAWVAAISVMAAALPA